jgi:hypothetical protein
MNQATHETIRAALLADIPILLWGPPGAGKSSLVEGIAEQMGTVCEVVVGSVREPSDFAGLPVVRETGGEIPDVPLAPPDWARRLADAGEGVVFLDELTTAPPAVQAAMLRVVLDRTVGSLVLPTGIRVVAAGNPPEQAADGWNIAPPLANRFLHLDVHPTADLFVTGLTLGWDQVTPTITMTAGTDADVAVARAQVAGFIQTRPDLLHKMPESETAAGRAWPSPRTWEMVSKILPYLPEATVAHNTAVCGLVGEGPGTEFLTWREHSDLPNPKDVLADPSIMDWDTQRLDRVFAVVTSIASYFAAIPADDKNAKKATWKALWGSAGLRARARPQGRADRAGPSRPRDEGPGLAVPEGSQDAAAVPPGSRPDQEG